MIKEEVKATVDSMEKEERTYLEAYLKVRNLVDDESFKAIAGQRLTEMKSGSALSSAEFKELNEQLGTKGL